MFCGNVLVIRYNDFNDTFSCALQLKYTKVIKSNYTFNIS